MGCIASAGLGAVGWWVTCAAPPLSSSSASLTSVAISGSQSNCRKSANARTGRISLRYMRATPPSLQTDIASTGKSANQCPAPFEKIFRFTSDPNHLHIPRHPGPHKGAFRDRHGRRVGMRWTQAAPKTRALSCGRRSRVVLTPRRWRQVLEKQASWGRRWQTSPVTGESSKQPLKPSRAGMPGDSGATVVTNARAYYHYTRGCGCNGHPAFPAPPW